MNDVNRWHQLPLHLLHSTPQSFNRGTIKEGWCHLPTERRSHPKPLAIRDEEKTSHHINRHMDSVRYHSWTSSWAATGWHLTRIRVIHHHPPEAEKRRGMMGGGSCFLLGESCTVPWSAPQNTAYHPGKDKGLISPQSCGWRLLLPQGPGNPVRTLICVLVQAMHSKENFN